MTKNNDATVNALSDWRTLKEAFHSDQVLKSWEICTSDNYEQYYDSLPALDISRLSVPANTNILFYGHSYLHQILDNILVANSDVLIKDGPFGGFEGDRLEDTVGTKATSDPTYIFGGYVTRWNFTVGSTIVEIQNRAEFQTEEFIDHLNAYLQENSFDVAVFMNPHPICYYYANCSGPLGNVYGATSQEYYDSPDDYAGIRRDAYPLWKAIAEAVDWKIYQVQAWSNVPNDYFHGDDAHSIPTNQILQGHACNQADNCMDATTLDGHQCQPGRLASIAELVMDKVRDRD